MYGNKFVYIPNAHFVGMSLLEHHFGKNCIEAEAFPK